MKIKRISESLRRRLGCEAAPERYVASLERMARAKNGYRPLPNDPTLAPPPTYTVSRAEDVLGETFRRACEYVAFERFKGDVYEFGTFRGFTARLIALHMVVLDFGGTLRLFDSFAGLPEPSGKDLKSYEVNVNRVWRRGNMNVERSEFECIQESLSRLLPGDRLQIAKGFFDETLPRLDRATLRPAILIHLDCDLYESALCALRYLLENQLVADGAVMLCDDYNCNRSQPTMGERLALTDAFREFPRYTYSPWFSYGWHGYAFFVHDQQCMAAHP